MGDEDDSFSDVWTIEDEFKAMTDDEKEVKLGDLLQSEYTKGLFTSTEPYSDYEQYGDKTKLPLTIQEALEIAYTLVSKGMKGDLIYDKMKASSKVYITKKIKKEVLEMAEYYGHHLVLKKLIDIDSLSDWQNSLATFLSDITRPMEERWTGLCISLPRFYKVDQIKETIIADPTIVSPPYSYTTDADNSASLTFQNSYEEKTKSRHVKTWVFTTDENSIADYSVPMDDISKIEMMDFIISMNSTLQCRYSAHSRRFVRDVNSYHIDSIFFSEIANQAPFLTEKA